MPEVEFDFPDEPGIPESLRGKKLKHRYITSELYCVYASLLEYNEVMVEGQKLAGRAAEIAKKAMEPFFHNKY